MLFLLVIIFVLRAAVSQRQSQYLNCITRICDRYFESGTTVVISIPCAYFSPAGPPRDCSTPEQITRYHLQSQTLTNHDETSLLHLLHDMSKWPVVLSRGSAGSRNDRDKWYNYILWASDAVSKQLDNLKSFGRAWNPRGRFLVLLNKIPANPEHVVAILKKLKDRKILNAIVLVPASREQQTLDLYSWFPYALPTGKCGQIQDVALMDQWIMHEAGHFVKNASLFPIKIPHHFERCPLTVSTFPFPPFTVSENVTYTGGFEIRLLEFVAETMNMLIVYRPPPPGLWGEKLENGSWTGINGDLTFDRADIGLAGIVQSEEECADMDFTVSHGYLAFIWVVPCAKPFPQWKSITRVFSLAAWLLIFMTIVLAAAVMACLATHAAKEAIQFKTLTGCLFSSWAVVLGVSAGSAPTSGPVRFLFIMWVWYSLAINTLFQTFVTSYLVDPGLQKQIQSIGDILTSGVNYGFHPSLKDNLLDDSDELTEIVTHSEPCNVVEVCTQRVAERGDFVTIGNNNRIEYLNTYKTLDRNGKALLCTFGDVLIFNFKTFLVPQGSPLLSRFNHAISVAVEAGLVDHWWEDMLVTSRIRSASIRRVSPLDEYSVFLLAYLQSAFYLLLLGYNFALLVFVGELLCYHTFTRSKHQNRKRNSCLRQANSRFMVLRRWL